MADTLTDRFDSIPEHQERLGAHRALAKRSRGLVGFGWALLATVALTAVGWVAIGVLTGQGLTSLTETIDDVANARPAWEVPAAEPAKDSTTTITVLNGTATSGLADDAQKALKALDWNAVSAIKANTEDVATTTVFYNRLDAEPAARALAADLGASTVQLATAYQGSTITVVLGADYRAPAAGS